MADANIDREVALSQEILMELLTEGKVRERTHGNVRLGQLSGYMVGLLSAEHDSLTDEVLEEAEGLAETPGGITAFLALDTGIWDDAEEEDRHHDAGVVGFTPRQFTYDCCICSVSYTDPLALWKHLGSKSCINLATRSAAQAIAYDNLRQAHPDLPEKPYHCQQTKLMMVCLTADIQARPDRCPMPCRCQEWWKEYV